MINNVKFTSLELVEVTNGTLVGGDAVAYKISTNSKEKSSDGHCFFAIKGEKFDGADYVEEAISNGAKIVVTQDKKRYPVSVIYVNDTVKSLGLVARRQAKNLRVIGVTGSYGKTSVKDMIISVLSEKYRICGTEKNHNNEIGVPLTLLSAQNVDFCVVEMGMRALGEIEWLAYLSEPELSVITSCGTAHIERLGSIENVFKAKTEILKYTKKACVLPCEKGFIEFDVGELNKILVGEGGNCFCEGIRRKEGQINFQINGQELTINSIYEHNAKNAVFAYAVGKYYGLSDSEIREGLKKWKPSENRGEIFYYKGVTVINDCYNASYESMISAISSLPALVNGNCRIAVLLGDMLELGKDAERLHKCVGACCKEQKVDMLFATGKYAKHYLNGYDGGTELQYDEIKDTVFNILEPGDVLLVKASHAMNFEKITNDLREK